MKTTYIIDFDSTFTQVEALDELARISLKHNPKKELLFKQIDDLTNLSMEGKLSFRESLHTRVSLLQANSTHLEQLVAHLKKKVSVSFSRNKAFFKKNGQDVLIVSGGFKEFILPVVLPYFIPKENIYANEFVFDSNGNIIGYDRSNPLSNEGGKVSLLKQLQLSGEVYGIGDGYSDFQLKEWGMIKKFYAFTENIERKIVSEKADYVVPSFDEFLYVNNLPMALSYPKSRIQCAVVGDIPEQASAILKKDGFGVRQVRQLTDLHLPEWDMLLLDNNQKCSEDDLKSAIKLKTIGYLGNSRKNIPQIACTKIGIVLFDDVKNNPRNSTFIPTRMIDFINKGHTSLSANFPNLHLPRIPKSNRLIHIHQNVPGVMAQINLVFAQHHINIVGQYLLTNEHIGYVITDIASEYDKLVLRNLKKVDFTIKFRVLY